MVKYMYDIENFADPHVESDEVVHVESSHTQTQHKKEGGILGEIKSLLNTNASTILSISISIAIGTAFNTTIMSFISDIIRPLCIKVLLFSGIYHLFYIDQIVNQQNINVGFFISSVVSFIVLCLLCYQINNNLINYL